MQKKSKKSNNSFGLKRFLAIANEYVNPDTTTFEGLQKRLIFWFCMKFNTVPWDNRIQEATLEELLTFYYMHLIKDDPQIVEELYMKGTLDDDFEDWLKKEMQEEYMTDAEFGEKQKELIDKEQEAINNLPDVIKTDFTNLGQYNVEEEN